MEILKLIQPESMLALSAICGVLTLLVYMTDTMSHKRKLTLMLVEISAMLLMMFDRRAYIYRGDTSTLGWWMVRICNFAVFFLSLAVLDGFTLYLIDLYTHEGGLDAAPRRLKASRIVALTGMAMVVVSQFTGFYYTFDEMNRYQRSPGFIVCYLFPMIVLILQLSVILQYRKRLNRGIQIPLQLFTGMCIVAPVLQVFLYGISLTNMTIAAMSVLLYIFALKDMAREVEQAHQHEIEYYKEQHKKEHALFEQTAEALTSAIDAKDTYTNGHSRRVAQYSLGIAKEAGKSEEECEKVYFAALLHDVGKIGVPGEILQKKGRLTDEEFAQIKRHSVVGGEILSSIKGSPWLSTGARYHHERYNGRGYPEGLKGEDIPEMARIIAVADAYDAMTSNRSYRSAIPQHIVREELVKGIGTQFDPDFARIMINMLDRDTEYRMQESGAGANMTATASLRCDSIYHDCTEGVAVTGKRAGIRLCSQPKDGFGEKESLPTLIVFDSLDGKVHPGEENNKDLLYFEYARIRLDGQVTEFNTRKSEISFTDGKSDLERTGFDESEPGQRYRVEAVRNRDHVLVRVSGEEKMFDVILALPDTSRFTYIALGGEHCEIHNIRVDTAPEESDPEAIPRIAEEISFIKDQPTGDIPNVQVDGPRLSTSEGIPVRDGMTLTFHTMSLPTARLVWHCPYISVFSASDGRMNGKDFREYLLLRLNGESPESDKHVENNVQVERQAGFEGWDVWKDENKKGLDCTVLIKRDKNVITMRTENLGIAIHSVTTILDDVQDVYVALTGDQCAITNIHVSPLSI